MCRENNDVIDAENCQHKSSEGEGSQEENPDTESNSMTTAPDKESVLATAIAGNKKVSSSYYVDNFFHVDKKCQL